MPKKKSAKMAKERLQIIISHERKAGSNYSTDFVPQLRKELVAVISKYIELTEEQINIEVKKDGTHSTIEMNVVIPNLEKEAEMA